MTELQRDNYIKLLDSVVLADIHDLLKKYKDENKEVIKLSGSKSHLIEILLDAVKSNIISEDQVQFLIKDSEEYGDQYIYFYEPIDISTAKKYNDGNKIVDSIMSPSIRSKFPKLTLMPKNFEWADFRFPNRGIADTWLIKIYDKKIREEKINETFDSSTSVREVKYKRVESRLIYIVEWNDQNQIEIKISRTSFDSFKSLDSAIKLIKSNIYGNGNGIDMHAEVVPVDLRGCITNLLKKSESNKSIYKLLHVSLVDSELGKASIRCFDDQGTSDLLAEGSRKKAIEAYMEGNGEADGISVRFLAEGSDGELKNDLNVILGKNGVNKIIIPAKIKPLEYKYVKRKIAEFS